MKIHTITLLLTLAFLVSLQSTATTKTIDYSATAFENHYSLAYENLSKDLSLALEHSDAAVTIADSIGTPEELARSYYLLGYVYFLKEDVVNSFKYYVGASLFYEQLGDLDQYQKLLNNAFNIAHEYGVFVVGENFATKRLEIIDQIDDYNVWVDIHYDLGLIYKQNKQYIKANKSFRKAKTILEDNGGLDDFEMYAILLNELGIIQMEYAIKYYENKTKYLDSAQYFFDHSFKVDESTAHQAKVVSNLALVELRNQQYQSAQQLFHKAMLLNQQTESKRLAVNTLNYLGELYFELGQLDSSHYYFNESLTLNTGVKSIEENQKDRSMMIDFYLYEQLLSSINYLDSLSVINPDYSNADDQALQAYFKRRAEKEMEFKKVQIIHILEEGYQAARRELKAKEQKAEQEAFWKNVGMAIIAGVAVILIIVLVFWLTKSLREKASIDRKIKVFMDEVAHEIEDDDESDIETIQ